MDAFDQQLRKDIARVIEGKGKIEKYARNLIVFTDNDNDYVPDVLCTWHVYKGTATRKVTTDSAIDDSYTKTETVYPSLPIYNANDFIALVKRILNPIRIEAPTDLSDIPF